MLYKWITGANKVKLLPLMFVCLYTGWCKKTGTTCFFSNLWTTPGSNAWNLVHLCSIIARMQPFQFILNFKVQQHHLAKTTQARGNYIWNDVRETPRTLRPEVLSGRLTIVAVWGEAGQTRCTGRRRRRWLILTSIIMNINKFVNALKKYR